jgi:hypothetical protein
LLLDPEAQEGLVRRLTEEHLHRLDFEKFDVIDEQFEGHLDGNVLRRRSPWWFWDARAEMVGALWRGHGAKIIGEQIACGKADRAKNGLGTTPSKAIDEDPIASRGNRQ